MLPLAFLLPGVLFVSTKGDDRNPGTESAPFRTLQIALDRVETGGTVLVRGGEYRQCVRITRPVLLLAAPGERPVLDGTGLPVPQDDAALVLIRDADRVTVAGFEIRNLRTSNSDRVPMGVSVRGKCDGVTVEDNRIHDIANLGKNAGSINAFGFVAYGDSKKGSITNLLVQGNEIWNTRTGNSETLTINGDIDGFRVLDNHVHDVDNIAIGMIGFEGVSPIPGKDQARNGLVAGNLVENVTSALNPAYHGERSSDGIYVDGGRDVVVERNVVRRADIGIEVASEHRNRTSANIVVRSNLVTLSQTTGISVGGYDAKRGGTLNCTIVDNTLVGNDTARSGTGEFSIQYNTVGNLFANNVVAANGQGLLVHTVTGAKVKVGVQTSNNLFDAPADATYVWQGRTYRTLDAFQKATGLELRSRFADPGFLDRAKGDYRLTFASPALDAGIELPLAILGPTDLRGNPRLQGRAVDLGAYEIPDP